MVMGDGDREDALCVLIRSKNRTGYECAGLIAIARPLQNHAPRPRSNHHFFSLVILGRSIPITTTRSD